MKCLSRRLLPPYYKYGVFAFCGLELLYSALVMAINQKFWDLSSKMLPIAYRMFNDTVYKGEPSDFRWSPVEYSQLQRYQDKLAAMWLSSTLVILFSMLCVVPQFCTTEDHKTDREITYCVKRPTLGWIMAPVLAFLIVAMGILLTWQWLTCDADAALFFLLFQQAQKEEEFLTDFELQLRCTLDDDKEIGGNWACDNTIDRSMLNSRWVDPLFYGFFACHTLMGVGMVIFNRDFGSTKTDTLPVSQNHVDGEDEGSESLLP